MWTIQHGGCLWVARWHARHPLFVVALVAVLCVGAYAWQPWCGYAIAVFCGLMGLWMVGWRIALVWWFCSVWVVGVCHWRQVVEDRAGRDLCQLSDSQVSGRVLEDARGDAMHWAAPVRLESVAGHDRAKVWWQGRGSVPVAGSHVEGWGKFEPLSGPRNLGEFDRAAWLKRVGVVADFQQAKRDGNVMTGRMAQIGVAVRQWFRQRVTEGLVPESMEAQVIRAVVLGERPSSEGEAVMDAFRDSGNLHVFSVSGLHVAMVGAMTWWVLGLLGIPRRWAVLVLLPWVFGYAWITGGSPPAMRAAWMSAIFLGAFVFRRKPDLLNALGGVLLVAMFWDGRLLFQPGVQLSYGVVAVMAVGVPLTTPWFARLSAAEMYLPDRQMNRWQSLWQRFRRWLAQSLSVSVAATVGSAPLSIYHFGLMAPVSILGALVLLPVVFLLLAVALGSVVVSVVCGPLNHGLNRLNGELAKVCVNTAEVLAGVPGGHWRTNSLREPTLMVYDLDHGDGAACFSAGGDGAVMIDCGGRWSFARQVRPSLKQLGLEPQTVVLTHPDGGHLGGGAAVWESLPVNSVVVPVASGRSTAYREWIDQAPHAGVRLHQAVATESLSFPDGAMLEVLHVPAKNDAQAMADQRVAVYRLHWRGWKFLFTSDAGLGAEQQMLDAGLEMKADVIIAGKNRADLSLTDAFVNAVKPRVIVIGNDDYPIEERIEPASIAYWRSRGILVIDQSVTGGEVITMDDSGHLVMKGVLDEFPWVARRGRD